MNKLGETKAKKALTFVLLMVLAMSSVFASSEDFGFNSYLTSIKAFMTAIGGGLIVLSLIIWGIKAAVTRNIQPQDWKALAIVFVAGVVIIIAGSVVGGIFSDLGGTRI